RRAGGSTLVGGLGARGGSGSIRTRQCRKARADRSGLPAGRAIRFIGANEQGNELLHKGAGASAMEFGRTTGNGPVTVRFGPDRPRPTKGRSSVEPRRNG